MQTKDFQIYSTANQRDTEATLRQFERVNAFLVQMFGREVPNPVPVNIILFSNQKEYEPYRLNEFATAYYSGNADRDYIVIGKNGENNANIVMHEYVHLFVRHVGLNLPPWLNEGLAELYSTMQPLGNSIEFGARIPGRVLELSRTGWVPLAEILSAGRDSPYYNEAKQAGSLYNQGWALTHYLATSEKLRAEFPRLVDAIAAGMPSEKALESLTKLPLAKLESDLKLHVATGASRKLRIKLKLDVSKEKLTAEPANMFDVRLALANQSGHQAKDEPRKRLEELAKEDPTRPEPHADLAYIEFREGRPEAGFERLAKAYELGDRRPKLLLDYGRMAARYRPEDGVKALQEYVKVQPADVAARIDLAGMQMNLHQPVQALLTLQPITNVTPELAPRLFDVWGNAQIQTGDLGGARITAKRLQEVASTDQYRQQAARMIEYLDRAERVPRSVAGAPPVPPTAAANEIQPAPPAPAREAVINQTTVQKFLVVARGNIVGMECGATPKVTMVDDGGRRKTFVILEPNRVVATGTQPTPEGIPCGNQAKPVPIRIHYELPPEGVDADGVIREMHF